MMKDEVRQSMMSTSTWTRGLYMLLFAFIYSLAEFVVVFICIFQFIVRLVSGDINDRLLAMSRGVCEFILEILQYETFNTDYKPFPFNPWPEIEKVDMSDEVLNEEAEGEVEDVIEGEVISGTDPKEEK
ncbi:MAG TPA: DUF4389 domain-containing protein [Gammaproteobacteria bacterium]|nr:DUF4389 domain-containing protein [Gammaproteobacteria bacterium]